MRTTLGLVLASTWMLIALGCRAEPSDGRPKTSAGPSKGQADAPEAKPGTTARDPAVKSGPTPPGPPGGHGADELHRLEGQTGPALVAEFGEPTTKREFTMAECCDEFEIELYNTYPPDSGHEAVVIHEWTWDYEGYALTVWLHQQQDEWRVLETSRYSDGVEF